MPIVIVFNDVTQISTPAAAHRTLQCCCHCGRRADLRPCHTCIFTVCNTRGFHQDQPVFCPCTFQLSVPLNFSFVYAGELAHPANSNVYVYLCHTSLHETCTSSAQLQCICLQCSMQPALGFSVHTYMMLCTSGHRYLWQSKGQSSGINTLPWQWSSSTSRKL